MHAVDLGLLRPLLEAQAKALSSELQAMFDARLDEVFPPLRNFVAAVQGWTNQVTSNWELLEVLADPSVLGEQDESAPLEMAIVKETNAVVGAGCSSELGDVLQQSVDDPPDLGIDQLGRKTQGVEELVKADDNVADIELNEAVLPISSTVEVSGTDNPFGCDGVPLGPTSPTLLDEYLSSFSGAATHSLLDAPIRVQFDGGTTCDGRRSVRLDKKNKGCSIPIAKRAEYRLAEAFGDLPKDMTSKKGTEEDEQEKMKAARELIEVNGSSLSL